MLLFLPPLSVLVPALQVAVGDIVKVLNGQYLPADMVLFSSRSGVLVGTIFKLNVKNNKMLNYNYGFLSHLFLLPYLPIAGWVSLTNHNFGAFWISKVWIRNAYLQRSLQIF